MSLLTEQEIYQMYSEPCSDAEMVEFAHSIEAAVLAKIKAQGPVVWMADSGTTVTNEDVGYTPNWTDYYTVPLYRLPEGD